MNKRVIALVLAVVLLCSPCTTFAAESSSAQAVIDSGGSMDSGNLIAMQDPGYYSAAYADYLLKLDNANAENGNPTNLWLSYMIKWKKAIPYEKTPDNYVYRPRNPKARAAETTLGALPMGAKVVDGSTKWGNQQIVWIKSSSEITMAPPHKAIDTTTLGYTYNLYWHGKENNIRPVKVAGAAYYHSERFLGRFPIGNEYSGDLFKFSNGQGVQYAGVNFYTDILSDDLKKAMTLALVTEHHNDRQDTYLKDGWVGFGRAVFHMDYASNDANDYAPYVRNILGNRWTYDYFPIVGDTTKLLSVGMGSGRGDMENVRSENHMWSSAFSYGIPEMSALNALPTGTSKWYGTCYTYEAPLYYKPFLALRDSTRVYATPDGNGVYTLVPSLVAPTITQSFNAGTNKSTITATATGATSMQITYGGTVIAYANGESVSYRADKNGSYTAIAGNGSISFSAVTNVTAIDDVAPAISYTAPAGGWASSKTTNITLTDAKTPSGMQYNIGGGWQSYNAPFSYTFTANGTISVMARDKWGCTSGAVNISAWQIDNSAPTAPGISKSPSSAWHKDTVTITIYGGSDVGSGINRYQYNVGGGWVNYSAPFSVGSSAAVYARTVDNVGFVSGKNSISVNIDRIKPTGAITYSKAWTKSNVVLSFTAADFGGSNVAMVRAGGGGWVSGAATTQTVSGNGSYSFDVIDNAGNTQTITENVANIDKIPPAITEINFIKTNDKLLRMRTLFNKQLEIEIITSDGLSGVHTVEYQLVNKGESINGSAWLPYSSAVKPRVTKRFDGTIAARCTDAAGNISAVPQAGVTVEDTPPTASHMLSTAEFTNKPVDIFVTGADELSGVASITLPDGGTVQGENAKYTAAQNGTYSFIVTDKCGNTFTYAVAVGNIDLTAPTAAHTLTPDSWTNGTVKINITGADELAGVKSITLPNGDITQGGTAEYTVSQNGTYHFTVTDFAGNTTGYDVTVDKLDHVAPSVKGVTLTATELPLLRKALRLFTPSYFQTQINVSIACEDDASGVASVEYQLIAQGETLNNTDWQLYDDAKPPVINKLFAGKFAARCTDAAGTSSDIFYEDIVVEDTPPTASHTLSTAEFTNKPVDIFVTGADELSGVASITLPDGGTVQGENAKYTAAQNGTYSFIVTDKCGNNFTYAVAVGNIDLTAPTAAHTLTPDSWTNGTVKISITGADELSGVASITLPNGDITQGGTAEYTVSQNGMYHFTVTDFAGNTTGYDVTVDKLDHVAPGITGFTLRGVSESPVKAFMRSVFPSFFAEQVELILSSEDDYSGIAKTEYQVTERGAVLDSGNWRVYDSGKPPRLEKEMNATVAVRTTDKADNISPVLSKNAIIDGSAPIGSHTLSTTQFTNKPVDIFVTGADELSGVASITLPDGGTVQGENAKYTAAQNGTYSFIVTDKCGNNFTYAVAVGNIDLTAPTAAHTLTPDSWTNGTVKISITGADELSGVKSITLPNGDITQGGTAEYTVLQNGTYHFTVTDFAGNTTGYDVTVDKLDHVAPGITGFTLRGVSESPVKAFMRSVFPSFFAEQVELILSSEDDYSGIAKTEYQVTERGAVLDSGNWRVYDSGKPPRLEKEMNATVAVRTTDKADNISPVLSKDAVIDGSAPIGSHTLSTTQWCNTYVIITVNAKDKWTEVKQITLPNGNTVQGSTASFRAVRNGNYEFILADKLGNSCSYIVPINNIEEVYPTPPKLGVGDADKPTDEMYMPDNIELGWEQNIIDVKSLAQSGIEKYQYIIKKRELPNSVLRSASAEQWSDSSGKIVVDNEGVFDVKVRSLSYAGNVSKISNYIVKNDYTPPTGTAEIKANEITLTAADVLSGVAKIECEHYGAVTVTYGSTVTCKMLQAETHIYTITDKAGLSSKIAVDYYLQPCSDTSEGGGSLVPSDEIVVVGEEPTASIPLPAPKPAKPLPTQKDAAGGSESLTNDNNEKHGNLAAYELTPTIKADKDENMGFFDWFNSLSITMRLIFILLLWLIFLLICYYIYRRVKKTKDEKKVYEK